MTLLHHFYTRGGKRVSYAAVLSAKARAAEAYRTGKIGNLGLGVQPRMAEEIDRMSAIEYANWSGSFTYRNVRK